MSFGMLFGTLHGLVLLFSMFAVVGLLYYGYRLYRPKRSRRRERLN
jgi:hypothetical protein